jgi:DNA-binding MarR family transcriptional regulator
MSEPRDNISELQDIPDEGGDLIDAARRNWARALPGLDTQPMAVVARLGRVTAYLDAGVNAALAEFGLTRSAWDVLASLRRQGEPYRLSPTALYVGLMRSSGAMTHRLRRLEQAGFVRRVPDPDDARGMLVELTPEGVALTERIAPLHMDNERELLSALTPDEQATLARLLRTMLVDWESRQPVPPPSGRGGRRGSRRATVNRDDDGRRCPGQL